MPKLGEIARGKDVGASKDSHKVIWAACPDCGKERWVLLRNGQPQSKRCHPCGAKERGLAKRGVRSGSEHHNWKGGKTITVGGYIEVWMDRSHPFFSAMAGRDGYVYEHRLVMAEHLGRPLDPNEEVHHRNRNKQDNRIENLELLSKSDHSSLRKEVDRLALRVKELEKENEELREQINTKTS